MKQKTKNKKKTKKKTKTKKKKKNKLQSEGRIRPQRMGKLSKHHKNGDGELQLISHGKVTGYLFANILGPLHYGSGAWVGYPVVIFLSG